MSLVIPLEFQAGDHFSQQSPEPLQTLCGAWGVAGGPQAGQGQVLTTGGPRSKAMWTGMEGQAGREGGLQWGMAEPEAGTVTVLGGRGVCRRGGLCGCSPEA